MTELEEAQKELATLRSANAANIQSLGTRGVALDPGTIIMVRINILLDTLWATDSIERVQFELRFENNIKEGIENLERELRKATLLNGVNLGQMIPPNGHGHE